MSKEISVITDSTASIPPNLAKEKDIDVIPAIITFEDESFRDGVDIGMEEFMRRLKESPALPTTAAPSTHEFITHYKQHPGGIISIHVGSGFSGIFGVAEAAAKEVGGNINVVDTGTTSLALGFMAMKAADLSIKGANTDQILKELEDMKGRTTVIAALNTLDNLKKGGRASYTQNLFGNMLQIKPILEIRDNKINVIEKPRTRGKSLARLVEITEALGPLEQVGVLYADTPLDAENIVDQIRRFHSGQIILGNIGPGLATHGGPGIVGVAAVRKK